MAFSRTARIWTLLIIDAIFLLIELVVGYAVQHLAVPDVICATYRSFTPRLAHLPWWQTPSTCSSKPQRVWSMARSHRLPSDVLSLVVALYAIKVRDPCLT